MTSRFAGGVAARLDRLPMTSGLWRLVILISLGGALNFTIHPPSLLNPKIIARKSKTRPQAKSAQIQSPQLMRRTPLTRLRQFQHPIAQLPNRRHRP